MSDKIKKISVIGRDLDAWVTALFLKSILDRFENKYDIELIELNTELTPHDFYAVLPSYKMLHKTLGADEGKLRATANSHIHFGQRFTDWNRDQPEFFHAYDRHGINFNGVDFYQYWAKAKQNGLDLPLEAFSLGVAAAKHRRFISGNDESGFSHAAHGYHQSAIEYTGAVARAALNAGVRRIAGSVKSVNCENERIISVELNDGTVVEADFYIDASGPDSDLINALSTNNFSDWGRWFQCDRMIAASGGPLTPHPAFSQITAFSCGWCGLYPLSNRTGIHVLYSSREADFNKVAGEIRSLTGADISNGVERSIRCGIAEKSWIGNCMAVGSAAATLEPLDALQQHPLVISLVMLRQLFPNGNEYVNERKIYNEKMHSFVGNLRNFQLAHYHLNTRDDPFWKACRSVRPPEALSEKIALFKHSGYVSIREDETFQEENWTSIFNGHGLAPEHYSPLVDNIQEEDLMKQFKEILRTIKERIESAPLID
ncbi:MULTISPECIES: tryptophan 7-halogenase [unclassified Microbulbifer]|uniref:tryptophan 7-halogenase n=1 Tax=unclassified Microbulbifer TaxID=2619833 RepID=UPI0027E40942|nr:MULTISPECIES: tryptophan 7-halogenase [unclassified Microbulbifer]